MLAVVLRDPIIRAEMISTREEFLRPTAILADDDSLARARFRDLLEEVPLVELVGEAADGVAALELIHRVRPDIVLLDIRMPGIDGIQVAERIDYDPVVIFTTAFDHYAATAFELAAVDYLLKPFDAGRLREALERAVRVTRRSDEGSTETTADRLSRMRRSEEPERIFLRDRDAIVPLPVREIRYVEADGDYVRIHTGERSFLIRVRLRDLEERLGEPFLRIHRSHLVNLDFVESFESHDDSRLAAVLRDGTRLVVSRSQSAELRRRSP